MQAVVQLTVEMLRPKGWIGLPMKRKEDPRLLTGKGMFTDDLKLSGTLYAAMLRSPYPHAVIRRIDASRALKIKGVTTVISGDDLKSMTKPIPAYVLEEHSEYAMAVDRVKHVGEVVAAVAAETRGLAEDALEHIDVEYEEIPAVVDSEKALQRDAPVVFEGSEKNVYRHRKFEYGDLDWAFRNADLVVKERLRLHSYSSTPMENNSVIADYNPDGVLTIWCSNVSMRRWDSVLKAFNLPGNKIRVVAGDVGGSFGARGKLPSYMVIVGCLALTTGRPVKYVEDRREYLLTGGHSAEQRFNIEMAVKKDGTILGYRLLDIDNDGSSPDYASYFFSNKLGCSVGCYKIQNFSMEGYSVATNIASPHGNSGVGKPGMCWVTERIVDIAARKLGLDPGEMRFKNFITPESFPYVTPSGNLYGSGDYPATLRKALEMIDYEKLREEQTNLRKKGRYIGIGLATQVDPGGTNFGRHYVVGKEALKSGAHTGATIRMEPSGGVVVLLSSAIGGLGHETTVAQVVAEVLGLHPDYVTVSPVWDSFANPWTVYSGAGGNSFTPVTLMAAYEAAGKLKEKIVTIAAHLLKARPEELELGEGRVFIRDQPEKGRTLADIAKIAYSNARILPEGMEPGLHIVTYYNNPIANVPDEKKRVTSALTFGNAAHAAVVEVDVETGSVSVLKYVIAHDCGIAVNPAIVDAMDQGRALHGINAALREEIVYDENGQMLTTTYMDYLKATASDAPGIEISHLTNPDPYHPLGAKAVGEGASLLSPPAIANAVEDALAPLGAKITDLPLAPERVWQLTRGLRNH